MKTLVSLIAVLLTITTINAQSVEELQRKAGENMSQGNYADAISDYEHAISLITDSTSHSITYAYAAICAMEMGNNTTAKDYFIESIKRGIEDPQVFDHLGDICRKEKDYENQIMAYKTGLERSPVDSEKYHLKLCTIYKKQKDAENLYANAEAVLANTPENLKALEYKGTALQYQKKMSDAEATFKTLYSLDNENINANIFLGNYNYQVGKSKLASSRKKYDKIVKPTRVQWHDHNEASKVTMEKYYRPAIMHLEFVNNKKANSNIKKMLFAMYTKLGETEKAEAYK